MHILKKQFEFLLYSSNDQTIFLILLLLLSMIINKHTPWLAFVNGVGFCAKKKVIDRISINI